MGLSIEVIWALVAALIPAVAGVAAYRKLGGTKPAPPQFQQVAGDQPDDERNRSITSLANSASVSDGAGLGNTTKK